ncbi:MAG: DUF4784 domain-containing protein [Muribaculaceae bacterium]|nr:DUF4784 domain-containing protein [Muribaculaceae bacterium]
MKKPIIPLLFIACLFLAACHNFDEPKKAAFITNAGITENGETLSPGSIIHLEGNGYLETDDVILNFFWETGDKTIPEGSIKGYRATVISTSADGMTIQMPYRKPASRVEVNLMRSGNLMHIGNVNLTGGLTPKELNLYGIYNATKIKTSLEKQITRWVDENNNTSDLKSWALGKQHDFHSAVGVYRAYGICGLSKEDGNQYPYFLDLCTQEWNRLNDFNTIALFSNGSVIGAIQTRDGKLYGANNVSDNLERSQDYLTSRSSSPAMRFQLPDGIDAEQFGEYPGAYTERGMLLSANKGNGKWIPVFFNPSSGFHLSDEIEAERLIPFALRPFTKQSISKDDGEKPQWISGYIVVKEESDNGFKSFFHVMDDKLSLSNEPIAAFPNKALSAAANPDRPGTLTVHFEASRSGNITSEYHFDKQEWTPINVFGSFDEIVWIN